VVNGHKSVAHTDSPDGGTGKTCLGGGTQLSQCVCNLRYLRISRSRVTNTRSMVVSAGYGIPVGQPAAAMTSRPSQPASARGAPVSGTPGRTYVGFTSPGNTSHTLLAYSFTYLLNYCVRMS